MIGRGLEHRNIFGTEHDKREFITRLGDNLCCTRAQCLAWALMSNHYHLLLRAGEQPLANLMAPVLGGYAGYFNRRHRRSGYVFQNRYQSILCDEENYLRVLVRYIHLNPLKAGIVNNVKQLDHYRWTGHAGLLGNHPQRWHATAEVLAHFGATTGVARTNYRLFIASAATTQSDLCLDGGGLVRSNGCWEAMRRWRREHIQCIGDERILGDSTFVESALRQDELKLNLRTHLERNGWTLDKLISTVCHRFAVAEADLTGKVRSQQLSIAKSLICFWSTATMGLTNREVGAKLGITSPGVSYRAKIGRGLVDSGREKFDPFIEQ